MTKRILPRRTRGGRKARRAKVYDTPALMELFGTDEAGVIEELAKMGITPHESAGRMFVPDYVLEHRPKPRLRK